MPNHFKHFLTLAIGAALLSTCPHTAAAKPTTTMVSVNSDGVQGNGHSSKFMPPGISGDGRYSVFSSIATNLVENDTNGVDDIFVHDARTGETTRVSVNSNGDQANAASTFPVISADGRYVAFTSSATNLVSGDTNGIGDIFVHDCRTGETTRASVNSYGVQGDGASHLAAISADGRYVAFQSMATQLDAATTEVTQDLDIFVRDRQNNTTILVSKAHSNNTAANDASAHPQISGNGRYVTFYSRATDLTTATDTNGQPDVFIRDLQTQTTSLVSATPAGTAGNFNSANSAISYDGRYVAFDSIASNLVDGDTNNTADVFLLDRNTNHTIRISGDVGGAEFQQASFGPSISADGRYITYLLYDGEVPIFRYDRLTGKATRVNLNNNGDVGNEESDAAGISADGNYVIFYAWASNLVEGDTNDRSDVFVRGPYLEKFPWPMFLPALTGGQK